MKEIKIPELAESIEEGTISEWLVQPGDTVETGDPVLELETDNVNVEVNTDFAGVITELVREEGDDVVVGDVIAKIDESGEGKAEPAEEDPKEEEKDHEKAKQEETPEQEKEEGKDDSKKHDIVASPAARKRARELGIDLNTIQARDPLGRIRPEDVEDAAAGKTKKSSSPAKKDAPKQAEKTEFDKPVERVKMTRRRQTIARNLVNVQHEAAIPVFRQINGWVCHCSSI